MTAIERLQELLDQAEHNAEASRLNMIESTHPINVQNHAVAYEYWQTRAEALQDAIDILTHP